MATPASILKFSGIGGFLIFAAGYLPVVAADLDESKLPPPASVKVDFVRDIKPILDTSCIRCHGPEKPKSKFRLDSREAALKGGEKDVDIIAGHSGKSLLIHYVANLVEDMEMPPSGKGKELTKEQVGLLRAWIDQGVVWDAATPTNDDFSTISFLFGNTAVTGDARKFREHYWQHDGINGGISDFESFQQLDRDTSLVFSGHALRDDYKIELSLDRHELGFVHSGWQQYRKYYDDTGGYSPALSPPAPSLGRDLHLDIGKAWIDFGLTLPDLPRMVLGYEYDFRQGEEALTSWGSTGLGAASNIAPTSKDIHEGVHIIKFDLDHDIYGVTVEDRFRGEFYSLKTGRTNVDAFGVTFEDTHESTHYFQGANTLRLERKFNDWLFGSAGYLYSKLNSDASFSDAINNFGNNSLALVPRITLERESHVFNLNGLVGPFDGLIFSSGVQTEFTRQSAFGTGTLNQLPNGLLPVSPAALPVNAATLSSDYDQSSVTENIAVRYTKIPFTVLFAEARLQQQRIGESDDDIQAGGSFMQRTDFGNQLTDMRVGFNTSPWQSVAFSGHYRRYENDSRYANDALPVPAGGYPGFIRERDVLTDEIEAKLVLHPASWLKTSLSWQYLTTDYSTQTGPASLNAPTDITLGGGLLDGETDSQIYSISTSLSPWRKFFLTTTFSYQTSTTITANGGLAALAPYKGNVYSVIANGTYVFNPSTDLFANYSFSQADYGQNNSTEGLPVGIQYEQHQVEVGLAHRWSKNISSKLQYIFSYYNEPTSGGANNYHAHAIFATFTFRLQ